MKIYHILLEYLLKDLKYSRDQVEDSLKNRKYDEIMATYMLLAAKSSEVTLIYIIATDI